ncbi:MAG: protein phosphatase 2C domain-containing protein [Pseudomonadota bacterium]|nr:protein phosphatase 2C domain-containing protein [Pseudomonadota bacterium]
MSVRAWVRQNGIELTGPAVEEKLRDSVLLSSRGPRPSLQTVDNAAGERYSHRPLGIDLPAGLFGCIQAARGVIRVISLKCPGEANPVNQDAAVAAIMTDNAGEKWHFAAVADGLGGSGLAYGVERGSRIAVLAALKIVYSLVMNEGQPGHRFRALVQGLNGAKSPVQENLLAFLAHHLERQFIQAVKADFLAVAGQFTVSGVRSRDLRYYGTTLAFSVMTASGGFDFRLGDGGTAHFGPENTVQSIAGFENLDRKTRVLGFEKSDFETWATGGQKGDPPLAFRAAGHAGIKAASGQVTVLGTDGLEQIRSPDSRDVLVHGLDSVARHLRANGDTLDAGPDATDDVTVVVMPRPAQAGSAAAAAPAA